MDTASCSRRRKDRAAASLCPRAAKPDRTEQPNHNKLPQCLFFARGYKHKCRASPRLPLLFGGQFFQHHRRNPPLSGCLSLWLCELLTVSTRQATSRAPPPPPITSAPPHHRKPPNGSFCPLCCLPHGDNAEMAWGRDKGRRVTPPAAKRAVQAWSHDRRKSNYTSCALGEG